MANPIFDPRVDEPDPALRADVRNIINHARSTIGCARAFLDTLKAAVSRHGLTTVAAEVDAVSGDAGTKASLRKLAKFARLMVSGVTDPDVVTVPDMDGIETD